MSKVAFYIDNNNIKDINCSEIANGNPGIGGTEYLFYYTVLNLQSASKHDLDIILLTSSDAILPDMNYYVVGNKSNAIEWCKKEKIDILVIKFEQDDFKYGISLLSTNNIGRIKIVIWAHNIIPNYILCKMSKLGGISAIVNVGREQLDLYRDNSMFYKSTYIYNSIPVKSFEYYKNHSTPFVKRQHEVTYLGSLIPVKGFHILAKIWKDVIKCVPDAHLNVIGSGQVYNTSGVLGDYGIADSEYEKQFMPYLIDENGNILPSVTFYGKLGNEKYEILSRTKVGVPNPAGTSETFCLSAVEMALWGARIVSKKYVGLIDTVPDVIGRLFKNEDEFKNMLISELNNDSETTEDSWKYCDKMFSFQTITNQWISFLKGLASNEKYIPDIKPVNSNYNLKYLREFNRRIKRFIPFGYKLPSLDYYISVICQILKIRSNTPIIKY